MPTPTALYDETMTELVSLPAGYFVLLVDSTAPDGYLKVAYDDISGYVKESSVRPVDYTPVNKYETTATFTCDNDGQKVNLRAAPSKNAAILSTLGSGDTVRSYGTIEGDTLIRGAGNIWHYVTVNGLRGYVYDGHGTASQVPPNVIEKEPPPQPEPPVDAPAEIQKSPQALSSTAAIIFIVALCVPVPFIMYYLFKKPKEK